MKTLLVINSSGRVTRSLTRRLTKRFAEGWIAHNPDGAVVHRDLGLNPPPTIDERWIAGAFAEPAKRTSAMQEALRLSDTFIDEIAAADSLILCTPIYNFGMPAQLKAYFDQIVRIGRTFDFTSKAAEPYRPLLTLKPVIVVTAAGDGSMHPGGAMAHLNFLEPHLVTILGFVGLTDVTLVRVGYEEFQDDRLKRSLAAAEAMIDALAAGRQFAKTIQSEPPITNECVAVP